ncbi:hypothetical protein N7533_000164 [Penicillium manginii]|uniref:uncharacterized protein n=1 Tax=Penicillium manginii TaxID=203109 RepID=UPI002548E3CB|nr:uncharacterized protein N7533_000164 [Penicillium manginii]KAJ5767581.1 hypothetical protein N7533_000164 [Penicillium manginii]
MSETFVTCAEITAQMARFINVLNSASLLPPESRGAFESLALVISARASQHLENMCQMAHVPRGIIMSFESITKQFNETIFQQANTGARDLEHSTSVQAQDVNIDAYGKAPCEDR